MGIAIVSVYPPRGEHHTKMSGVASMTKNIATTASNEETVHVIGNRIEGGSERYADDDGDVVVHRCWDRGPLYPLQIVATVRSIEDVEAIHVHHEYDGMYGGVLMNVLFPVLLFGLHLADGKIITQPHGIVFDTDLINTKSATSLVAKLPDTLLGWVLLCFNQLLVTLSDTLVVPNSALKREVQSRCLVAPDSVVVIPHGVESSVTDVRNAPSDTLTLLYFGYITWRKGPDILAEAAASLPDTWEIVLAGGEVPYLSSDPNYRSYYDEVRALADRSDNVTVTGFVEEEDLDTYFTKADVLVLPYRKFVAASGVFSLGLRYSLPFLLSEEISPLLENPDIESLMDDHGIERSTLTFSAENAGTELETAVRRLCSDPERYAAVSSLSREICRARNWEQLRDEYMELYQ